MEYLKDQCNIDWDIIHASHNERVRPLRTAYRAIVLHDIETGVIPKPE